jgi:plastocyanin
MTSEVFDTYLVLEDPDGTVVAQNDDRSSDLNSRIVHSLSQSGTYTIWCSSFSENATGTYELTLEEAEGGEDLRSIAYGETKTGAIDAADGTAPEYGGLAEPVSFDGEEGDTVEITMTSEEFDTYLVLADPDGTVVAQNDDGAGSLDSRIVHTLSQSGSYTIWCSSFSENATGTYELSLATVSEEQLDLESIAYGETREGFVDATDGNAPEYGGLAEPVTFEGEEGDPVEITMTSEVFDTYLVLEDPDGNVVAQNDDGAESFNSRITRTLSQSGTYTIWCSSYSEDATGTYQLTLERTD